MSTQPLYTAIPSFVALYKKVRKLQEEYPEVRFDVTIAHLEGVRRTLLLKRLNAKQLRHIERKSLSNLRLFEQQQLVWDKRRARRIRKSGRLN